MIDADNVLIRRPARLGSRRLDYELVRELSLATDRSPNYEDITLELAGTAYSTRGCQAGVRWALRASESGLPVLFNLRVSFDCGRRRADGAAAAAFMRLLAACCSPLLTPAMRCAHAAIEYHFVLIVRRCGKSNNTALAGGISSRSLAPWGDANRKTAASSSGGNECQQ